MAVFKIKIALSPPTLVGRLNAIFVGSCQLDSIGLRAVQLLVMTSIDPSR